MCFATLLSVAGCGGTDPQAICAGESKPAITVAVRDSITNQPIPGFFPVIATDGAFVDTTAIYRNCRASGTCASEIVYSFFTLAYDRAGLYRVDVQADGYKPWSRLGIRVDHDQCGFVETVAVTALLQR